MKSITTLAVNNLKHNKIRSVLIAVSIILTTCLLAIIALIGNGLIKHQKVNAGIQSGEFDASYINVTEQELEQLKIDKNFFKVGVTQTAANIELKDVNSTMIYLDKIVEEMIHLKVIEGRMPEKRNEITAPKELFTYLGLEEPKINDTVSISYRILGKGKIITEDFIISGFLNSTEINNLSKSYSSYISKSWYEANIKPEERLYTTCVKAKNEENLNYEFMEKKLENIAKEHGISKNRVMINTGYLMWILDPGTEILVVCIGIGILVILFSVIVIYNIFYVGIVQKVQEYGKLRAIGTTKKQLKGIILREGMILALFSIPLGLILGYLGSEIVFKFMNSLVSDAMEGAEIIPISLFNPLLLFLVAILSTFTVFLGLRKPMKMAAKISPVEAMRYQETIKGKKTRKGYYELSVFRLMISNLSRNKKRTIMTICTMGLSCILFVIVANIASSMNAEDNARRTIEKGDFYIRLDFSANDTAYPENNLNHIQQLHLMDTSFIEQIKAIEGITKVETRNCILAKSDYYKEGNFVVSVLSKEDYNSMKNALNAGTLDYEKASIENEAVFLWGDYWMEEFGYEIGDKIQFTFFDGDRTVDFTATLGACTSTTNGTFAITEDSFKKLGMNEDFTTEIFISCGKNSLLQAEKEIKQFLAVENYYIFQTYQDAVELSKKQNTMLSGGAYAFLIVLGVIGFMNLANTLITSIFTRKRELGILQAIGLTTHQLNHMLQMEGSIFIGGTLAISLTVGNIIGYFAVLYMKKEQMLGITSYSFPFVEIILMSVVLASMQIILSYYMSKKMQKDTLIERIRHQE